MNFLLSADVKDITGTETVSMAMIVVGAELEIGITKDIKWIRMNHNGEDVIIM